MFDMSWGEVMLIGGVALIVIGPKDLPKALRTVGQVTTKLRRMAGEFQMQFSEAIREAELDEVRKDVDGIRNTVRAAGGGFNPVQTIRDELKGAVEGRAKADAVKPAPVQTGPDPAAGLMGPERPAEARSLADATAQLRAEQGVAPAATDPLAGGGATGSEAPGAPEPPLPVPGSVDDPYGMPPDPAPLQPAADPKNGAAGPKNGAAGL